MDKTCADCIHHECCCNWTSKEIIDSTDYDAIKHGIILECKTFEDKSRFIELPCAVGDTVYFIDTCRTAEDYGKKFINFSRVKRISIDNEFAILHDHSVILFENLFPAKEDAEKAMKGGAEE